MTGINIKINKIIEYWNSELLCSLESSTSHADVDLAYLDNIIENRELQKILSQYRDGKQGKCLDVGAGYGRFTKTFLNNFDEIILLEAAPIIFTHLQSLWGGDNNIKCISETFETFEDQNQYALIMASGLLYLYEDTLVRQFLEKSRAMLKAQGLLILRDFIAEPQRVVKSSYVRDGFCHYREPKFWNEFAKASGFELLQIDRSKPRLTLLRNSRTLTVLSSLHIKSVLKNPLIVNMSIKFGDWKVKQDEDVKTVFIVMRAR